MSDWQCDHCGLWVSIARDIHGLELVLSIVHGHRRVSPVCPVVFISTVPVVQQQEQRSLVTYYLEPQVARIEEKAMLCRLRLDELASVSNQIVWLDCQLGVDIESMEVAIQLERLRNDSTSLGRS